MGGSKTPVFDLKGNPIGEVETPKIFCYPIHSFLIRRAVAILQTHRRQKQGKDSMAGKRTSAESLGTGYGLARVPRIKGTRRAAFVTMAVKGRSAHAPTSEKKIYRRINKKERRVALISAIASTADSDIVKSRGHRVEQVKHLPLVIVDEIESLSSTKEVKETLKSLGLWDDLERIQKGVKARSGKSRLRGRVKRVGKGPLIVVSEDKGIGLASRNLPGVEVVRVKDLNPEILAPGGHPGRLTLWSLSAFKQLDLILKKVGVTYVPA